MRLTLRVLINFMNLIESQLEMVDNELRSHPAYRTKFQVAKKQFRAAVQTFVELNDDMGDSGVN